MEYGVFCSHNGQVVQIDVGIKINFELSTHLY